MLVNLFFSTNDEGTKSTKRIAICQDTKKLEKINEFNYIIEDIDFIKYFQDRTGIIITHCLDRLKYNSEPKDKIDLNIKRRLQDCWEIWENIN